MEHGIMLHKLTYVVVVLLHHVQLNDDVQLRILDEHVLVLQAQVHVISDSEPHLHVRQMEHGILLHRVFAVLMVLRLHTI